MANTTKADIIKFLEDKDLLVTTLGDNLYLDTEEVFKNENGLIQIKPNGVDYENVNTISIINSLFDKKTMMLYMKVVIQDGASTGEFKTGIIVNEPITKEIPTVTSTFNLDDFIDTFNKINEVLGAFSGGIGIIEYIVIENLVNSFSENFISSVSGDSDGYLEYISKFGENDELKREFFRRNTISFIEGFVRTNIITGSRTFRLNTALVDKYLDLYVEGSDYANFWSDIHSTVTSARTAA